MKLLQWTANNPTSHQFLQTPDTIDSETIKSVIQKAYQVNKDMKLQYKPPRIK